jgi:hypothetical protein
MPATSHKLSSSRRWRSQACHPAADVAVRRGDRRRQRLPRRRGLAQPRGDMPVVRCVGVDPVALLDKRRAASLGQARRHDPERLRGAALHRAEHVAVQTQLEDGGRGGAGRQLGVDSLVRPRAKPAVAVDAPQHVGAATPRPVGQRRLHDERPPRRHRRQRRLDGPVGVEVDRRRVRSEPGHVLPLVLTAAFGQEVEQRISSRCWRLARPRPRPPRRATSCAGTPGGRRGPRPTVQVPRRGYASALLRFMASPYVAAPTATHHTVRAPPQPVMRS